MTALDATELIPIWISLGIAILAFGVFLILALWLSRTAPGYNKQAHAVVAMLAAMAIIIMDVATIGDQPHKTRNDGVDAWYGKWIAYVFVFALFSWATANVLSNNAGRVAWVAIAFTVLGAALLLVAVFTPNNMVWAWYSFGLGFWIAAFTAYVYIYWSYGKPYGTISLMRVIILLGWLALIFTAFGLTLGLGHSVGNVITSLTVERYMYTFVGELLLWGLLLFCILWENNLIPRVQRFIGYPRREPMRAKMGNPPPPRGSNY